MKSFEGLSTGDIVRHKNGGEGYVVTANYGDRVTAVRTVDMSNPPEWDLVFKAKLETPKPEVREECGNCGYHRQLKSNEKLAFSDPSKFVRCILPNNQYAEATYKCPMWYLESEKVEVKKTKIGCSGCKSWIPDMNDKGFGSCETWGSKVSSISEDSFCVCWKEKNEVRKNCKTCKHAKWYRSETWLDTGFQEIPYCTVLKNVLSYQPQNCWVWKAKG